MQDDDFKSPGGAVDHPSDSTTTEAVDCEPTSRQYEFAWANFLMISLGLGLTSLIGFCLASLAFGFAKMAHINQGCIPCVFSVTSVYVSILFYFKFGEVISNFKIGGIALMFPCIFFLSKSGASPVDASGEEHTYAMLAMAMGLSGPFVWTVRCLYLRMSEERYRVNLLDASFDSVFFQNVPALGILAAYLATHGLDGELLLQGALSGVFNILGTVSFSVAFRYGPGGPINALHCTQIVYQTLINALFFGQALTTYSYVGIAVGLLATAIISCGDDIYAFFSNRNKAPEASIEDSLLSDLERSFTANKSFKDSLGLID